MLHNPLQTVMKIHRCLGFSVFLRINRNLWKLYVQCKSRTAMRGTEPPNGLFAAPQTILVAPLDWGIGHAARMVPVVRQLLTAGHRVVLATDGQALDFMRHHFGHLPWVRLPGYGVQYPRRVPMAAAMLLQLPRIVWAIAREHRQIGRICRQFSANVVLSDNRYGLFTRHAHTIFVTHQIAVRAPWQWLQRILFEVNKWFILRFDALWVPDFEGGLLTGQLTQAYRLPRPPKYIGPLSRFYHEAIAPPARTYDVLLLLSGPEPQRTAFEEMLVRQLAHSPRRVLLVRGLPALRHEVLPDLGRIVRTNFLAGNELANAIRYAGAVVCRSGYSTLMDLVALGKTAILVPTPGQTEQEYLGEMLMQRGWFLCQKQKNLDIETALHQLSNFALPQNLPKPEIIDRINLEK